MSLMKVVVGIKAPKHLSTCPLPSGPSLDTACHRSPSSPVWIWLATSRAGFPVGRQWGGQCSLEWGCWASCLPGWSFCSPPVTVSALDGDSDMEISDDDRPLPSSVSSCLQTHPPPHQEAHDFLSSLFLEPAGEGVWPGDGTVDEKGAGVCSGAWPVDTAGGALVATIPDVDPLRAASLGEGVWPWDGTVDEEGAGVCPGARPVDTAGGALVATIPDVDLLNDASVSLHGHALGPVAPVDKV
jgi:hypothetical protein